VNEKLWKAMQRKAEMNDYCTKPVKKEIILEIL